jgi:hydrogenase/urease accessory protein HupE
MAIFMTMALALGLASPAAAHPLAPALLELVDVLWKQSALARPGTRVEPILPAACPALRRPEIEEREGALRLRWAIDCREQGLVGQPLRIDGLDAARIDALVRIELADGRRIQRVLRAGAPDMTVPARASRTRVFADYARIGLAHILSGADHLLFVFGLFLLCTGLKSLVQTVTAFTAGHSITLSLAALGHVSLPSGPVELLIAVSVLALAVELARDAPQRSWMRRRPWAMALVFGLLHGLGFAGALREVGLPAGEIPMALFSFNLGIEIGQLAFVLTLLALAPWMQRLPVRLPRRGSVYVMGSLAALWVFQRAAAVL